VVPVASSNGKQNSILVSRDAEKFAYGRRRPLLWNSARSSDVRIFDQRAKSAIAPEKDG
jgi:hypothetical protein